MRSLVTAALTGGLLALPALARAEDPPGAPPREPPPASAPVLQPEASPVPVSPVAAQPVSSAGVPIRIETDGTPAQVAMRTPAGEAPLGVAPCTVHVPPYAIELITEGPAYTRRASVVDVRAPTRFQLDHRDGGAVAGGAVLLTFGVLFTTGGVVLALGGALLNSGGGDGGPVALGGLGAVVAGIGMITAGAIVIRANNREGLRQIGPLTSLAPRVMALPEGGAIGLGGSF